MSSVSTKPCVLIATPCYGGQLFYQYVVSLLQTIAICNSKGIRVDVTFVGNESLISRGRNYCVANFLKQSSFTHLLFIDADISWDPTAVLRLVEHDKDLVGGIYPHKAYYWSYLQNRRDEIEALHSKEYNKNVPKDIHLRHNLLKYNIVIDEQCEKGIKNNLVEVSRIATGFMMIKRNVIEKMIEAYPETKYNPDTLGDATNPDDFKYYYALFDCEVKNQQYLSEDWMFCDRWRKCGGKIYADITLPLSHTGTHTFEGRLLSTLNIDGDTSAQNKQVNQTPQAQQQQQQQEKDNISLSKEQIAELLKLLNQK